MIAALSLNPAIDKVVSLQAFRWGEHIRVKKLNQVPSGKGINVARVIKKLGGEAVIIGVAGGPNGEWIKEELKKEKLKFDFVDVKENVRENTTIIDERMAREIHLREEGKIIDWRELAMLKNKLKKWAPSLKFFIISGRLPTGVPVNFYRDIISFFRRRGVPVLLDTNGPAYQKALMAGPNYIKPNLLELEELAGKRLRGKGKEIDFIRCLLKQGIDMVVLTRGPGDVLAMTSDWGMALTPPRICVRNTVGSGDAVTGALAYGLTEGLDIRQTLKLSIACGSANTISICPGFLDMSRVNALIKKVNVKVLYNHRD